MPEDKISPFHLRNTGIMGSKKLRNRDKPKRSASRAEAVRLLNYEITFDPIPDEKFQRLPESVRVRTEVLHSLIGENSAPAIPELLDLIRQYPDIPVFSNFLQAAYMNQGEREAAHAVMLDSYHKFPDYLFAKLTYGEFLLHAGKTAEFADMLNHKFDLKLLLPERTVFHVSEYTAFVALVGWYFCQTGKIESASLLLNSLRQIAPDHPATGTLEHEIAMATLEAMAAGLKAR